MVNAYNPLEGSQDQINRRLLARIVALEEGETGETADISDLKTAVGDSSSGLVKDVADIKAAIGTDDTTDGGLKKRCKAIETAIGADDTEGTIKGRIYALEHPPANSGTE